MAVKIQTMLQEAVALRGQGGALRRINSDEAVAREFLADARARLFRFPHCANRAVIYKSDLIHKTSECRFAEGYRNKRINLSLLFGHRPD